MKILITGACGMIGFHVSDLLLKLGHQVVGVDYSKENYQTQALKKLQEYPLFQFLSQDVKDMSISLDINAVIHLAAHPGIKFSYDNPRTTLENNQLSFLNVLEHCRHLRIPLFFASSSSVYANESYLTEKDPLPQCLNVYALSKKHNEETAQMYSQLYGVKTYALRFFTVFGAFSRQDMLAHKIMQAISQKQPLTLYGNGLLKRDFTYAPDVAQSILFLLEKSYNSLDNDCNYQVYNIGGNHSVELLRFVEMFENAFSKNAYLKLIQTKPIYDAQETQCNNTKLINEFPLLKFTSLEHAVNETVSWYKTMNL